MNHQETEGQIRSIFTTVAKNARYFSCEMN